MTRLNGFEDKDELSRVTSLLWGFIPFHAARFAVNSGLLELLADRGHVHCDVIASCMRWRLRPTQLLLDILEAVGLVDVSALGVSATAFARRWLVKEGQLYVGAYFDRLSLLEEAYGALEARLATDSPYPPLEAETLQAFGLGNGSSGDCVQAFCDVLEATSTPVAEAFLELANIPENASVLDVGAGTGVFTRLLLCRGHKGMVEFLDTPSVCERARHALAPYAARIAWAATNWNDWQPGRYYDTIFLHHVLHEERKTSARRLLLKCADALAPGGHLYVIGMFATDTDKNALASLFSMNIMLEVGGDNTTLSWLRAVADEAPLKEVGVYRLPGGRTLWAASRRDEDI